MQGPPAMKKPTMELTAVIDWASLLPPAGTASLSSHKSWSATGKKRHRRQKEHEKKHVDIDEHLMSPQAVVARYRTNIRMDRPETSLGLSSQEAEERLREHGLNILTPHKTRHPFVKYLICLSSLFNLLLILAGALEYILLGINFTENLQSVGPTLTQAKD